ncbi:hypothetical protein [Mycobacterium sp.]|uniref:hypothetical protein n=1 Tax=Mycobacterium sp. TaxID=1785 RepID=UPI003C779EB1
MAAQRSGSGIHDRCGQYGPNAFERGTGALQGRRQRADRGERLEIAGDYDNQSDRRSHGQRARHRQHGGRTGKQDERQLAGHAEQQLARNLHAQ